MSSASDQFSADDSILGFKYQIRYAPFWKTIRVWCTAIAEQLLNPADVEFWLITTSGATEDSIVALLQEGNEGGKATALIEMRSLAERNLDQKTLCKAYQSFHDLDSELQVQLVSNVKIDTHAPDFAQLNSMIESEIVWGAPSMRSAFAEILFGRWEMLVERFLLEDDKRFIPFTDLQWVLHEIHLSLEEDSLPEDFTDRVRHAFPPLAEDNSTFLRQLEAVSATARQKRSAQQDHELAKQLRSFWLRHGLLAPDELPRYEQRLIMECDVQHQTIEAEETHAPEDSEPEAVGRRVLAWAVATAPHQSSFHIRARCTRAEIVRGSFHELANRPALGWHPSWRVLFGSGKEEDLLDAG
jgi:hypothetical protein